ncbi:hypothetical protein [Streptomyces sp. NPDC000618]
MSTCGAHGLDGRGVGIPLLARLNRDGRGTRVEFHPLDQYVTNIGCAA